MGFSLGRAYKDMVSAATGKTTIDTVLGNDDFASMIPGVGDAMAAQKQNAANIAAAQKQMDFQERMSNTAYQRAMEDMKKAGLNPMLAFSQGGASTPSGALPTINSETKSKLGEFAMNSALGVKNSATAAQQANTQQMSAEQGIRLSQAQTAQTQANTAKAVAETRKTELENKRAQKYEPVDDKLHQLSKAGSTLIDKLIESTGNAAKQVGKALTPKPNVAKPNPLVKPLH